MTKRILITGAGGFVGHHFLEHILVHTDWAIVITDSFRHKGTCDRVAEVLAGSPDVYGYDETWWRSRITVVTHDLLAPFTVREVARIGHIDYFAGIASESHVDRSITDPAPFIRNNIEVAVNSLELARQLKPQAMIWVSTDEVYGPVAKEDLKGHPEWDTILPSNPYSGSKAAQEDIAISYWRTYGVPVIILNIMNMIGERQDLEKFIPRVIAKVSRDEELTIHGSLGNIGTRHYLHARNVADASLFLLDNTVPAVFPAHVHAFNEIVKPRIARSADRPDRYNIASPDRIDNLTLAKMIAEFQGKELKYKLEDFHTTRPGHDPHYGLNPAKIMKLGWEMPVSFRESLKRTVEWTLQHPDWLVEE
jgi:dTDP-glucose 4,6-dehydratase